MATANSNTKQIEEMINTPLECGFDGSENSYAAIRTRIDHAIKYQGTIDRIQDASTGIIGVGTVLAENIESGLEADTRDYQNMAAGLSPLGSFICTKSGELQELLDDLKEIIDYFAARSEIHRHEFMKTVLGLPSDIQKKAMEEIHAVATGKRTLDEIKENNRKLEDKVARKQREQEAEAAKEDKS